MFKKLQKAKVKTHTTIHSNYGTYKQFGRGHKNQTKYIIFLVITCPSWRKKSELVKEYLMTEIKNKKNPVIGKNLSP